MKKNTHSQPRNVVMVLSDWFSRIAVWSFDHRWWVLFFCLSLMGVSAWLAKDLRIDNSFEAYFDHNDPVYSAYLQFRDDFGSDENSFILYTANEKEHGPFNLEVMQQIAQLTHALETEVPFVKEVTSLSNAELVEGVEDGLEISNWDDDFSADQQSTLDFRKRLLKKPMYVGGLVNEEATHGAILIDMDRSSIDPIDEIRLDPQGGDGMENVYPQVTEFAIRKILERPEYKNLKFWHSGDVALNSEMNLTFKTEGTTLGVVSMVLIMAVLFVLFQFRILGVLGPLVVVLCSVMTAMAVMAVMGWRWDMMAVMMPTMIIAIGVAAAVHILSEFYLYYEKTGDRRLAIQKTLYLVGPPCLLTSLTTAAGYMSMSVSPIKALSHMALYAPVGIIASFVFSVTLLMFFLSFGKNGAEKKKPQLFLNAHRWMSVFLVKTASFVIRTQKIILWVSLAIFIFACMGVMRIAVDSNFIEEFSDRVPVKLTTKYIDKVMGGTGGVVYLFDTGVADGIKNPDVLHEIERVQNEAAAQDYLVKKTYSIVDLIKDINQSFNEGNPDYYVIPDSAAVISQLLFVYEISGGDNLKEYVSSDYSRANLDIRCRNTKTSVFEKFRNEMNAYLEENPVKHSTLTMTGIGKLWLQLIDHIINSQIKGLLLACLVISAMMCLIFRSIKVGMLSMIPNIAPVFLTLGMMGWAGIDLDYTRLMIASIAIGIVVDDTIHLVTRYQHEFFQVGSYEKALYQSFENVGRALVITSLVLVIGFSVFLLSVMTSTMMFGVLICFTVSVALVADFLLLPALLMAFKPFGPEFKPA